jgi:CDP-diacylglycerol--glycerol-3-phosphate 3-phosphatidyltransferase
MANLITLSRLPLLLVLILMLYLGNATVRLVAVPVFFVVLILDTFDGLIARRRGEASLLGSVLDIAADRVLELSLWVVFSDLGLISVAVPLIVITRGVLVDGVRSVGAGRGERPLDQVRSRLGSFLVGSRWMRTGYGLGKGLALGFLTLTWGLQGLSGPAANSAGTIHLIATILTWIAVGFCLLRGLPVLVAAPELLRDQPSASRDTSPGPHGPGGGSSVTSPAGHQR